MIAVRQFWPSRAVDDEGEVIDLLVQLTREDCRREVRNAPSAGFRPLRLNGAPLRSRRRHPPPIASEPEIGAQDQHCIHRPPACATPPRRHRLVHHPRAVLHEGRQTVGSPGGGRDVVEHSHERIAGRLQADLLTQDLRASPRDHAAADDQRLGRREASALGDAPCPRRRAIPKQDSILHGVPHGGLKRAPRRIDTVCPVGPRVASTANSRQSGIVFRLLARPTPS